MFRLCSSHMCNLQVTELHDESHSEGEGEAVGLSAVQSLPQQLQQQMQQPHPPSTSLRCEAAEEPAPAGSSDSGSGATSGPDAGLSRGSLHESNGIEEGAGRQEHQPQHRADWAAPGRGFAGGWTRPST